MQKSVLKFREIFSNPTIFNPSFNRIIILKISFPPGNSISPVLHLNITCYPKNLIDSNNQIFFTTFQEIWKYLKPNYIIIIYLYLPSRVVKVVLKLAGPFFLSVVDWANCIYFLIQPRVIITEINGLFHSSSTFNLTSEKVVRF